MLFVSDPGFHFVSPYWTSFRESFQCLSKDGATGAHKLHNYSGSKAKQESWSDDYTFEAIKSVLEYCSDYLDRVFLYEEVRLYHPKEKKMVQIYRALPYKEGKPWYDWAIFDLSKPETPNIHDRIPCQIKCIVDLTSLPPEAKETIDRVPGVCGLVEPAYPNDDNREKFRSEFWDSVVKKPSGDPTKASAHNMLLLVPLNKLVEPTTVCLMSAMITNGPF